VRLASCTLVHGHAYRSRFALPTRTSFACLRLPCTAAHALPFSTPVYRFLRTPHAPPTRLPHAVWRKTPRHTALRCDTYLLLRFSAARCMPVCSPDVARRLPLLCLPHLPRADTRARVCTPLRAPHAHLTRLHTAHHSGLRDGPGHVHTPRTCAVGGRASTRAALLDTFITRILPGFGRQLGLLPPCTHASFCVAFSALRAFSHDLFLSSFRHAHMGFLRHAATHYCLCTLTQTPSAAPRFCTRVARTLRTHARARARDTLCTFSPPKFALASFLPAPANFTCDSSFPLPFRRTDSCLLGYQFRLFCSHTPRACASFHHTAAFSHHCMRLCYCIWTFWDMPATGYICHRFLWTTGLGFWFRTRYIPSFPHLLFVPSCLRLVYELYLGCIHTHGSPYRHRLAVTRGSYLLSASLLRTHAAAGFSHGSLVYHIAHAYTH